MNISRTSWHYKALAWTAMYISPWFDPWNAPKSLCAYFWRFISLPVRFWFALHGYIAYGLGARNNVQGVPLITGIFLVTQILGLLGFTPIAEFGLAFAGVILGFVAVMLLAGCILGLFLALFKGLFPGGLGETIVGQYIQAKKDKVCPVIEYKD